jgi:hypothetical protein
MKETGNGIDPIIEFRQAAIAKRDGVGSATDLDRVCMAEWPTPFPRN